MVANSWADVDLCGQTWHESWDEILKREMGTEVYYSLEEKLTEAAAAGEDILPPQELVLNAFSHPFDDVSVVILGQDPFHKRRDNKITGEKNIPEAMGLSFSVPTGIPIPPSLRNIFKELESDLGIEPTKDGDLSRWADQGVMLLNSGLTVAEGTANSHAKWGWHTITDNIIRYISEKKAAQKERVVFILWGGYAQKKKKLIDTGVHTVLESAHPSPLSAHRGFFGSRIFSRCNEALKVAGKKPIDW